MTATTHEVWKITSENTPLAIIAAMNEIPVGARLQVVDIDEDVSTWERRSVRPGTATFTFTYRKEASGA